MKVLNEMIVIEVIKNEFIDELKNNLDEAITPQGLDNLLKKYAQRINKPEAYNELMRHALETLGQKTSASEQDLDMDLKKFSAEKLVGKESPPTQNQQTSNQAAHPAASKGQKAKDFIKNPVSYLKNRQNSKTAKPNTNQDASKEKPLPTLQQLAAQELGTGPNHKPYADLPDIVPQKKDEPINEPPSFDDVGNDEEPEKVAASRLRPSKKDKKDSEKASSSEPKAAKQQGKKKFPLPLPPDPVQLQKYANKQLEDPYVGSWKVGKRVKLGKLPNGEVMYGTIDKKTGNRWFITGDNGKKYVQGPGGRDPLFVRDDEKKGKEGK